MKQVPKKLLRVETEYYVAGAVFGKLRGQWVMVGPCAPILMWMHGLSAGEIHLELLRLGAKWGWLTIT
jgi:hypothetical protein